MVSVLKKSTTVDATNGEVDCYYYNRALLGTAEKYAFINRLNDNNRPDPQAGKTGIKIFGTTAVKRIPSPVLYKIAGNSLYMIVREHSDAIYGAQFKFMNEKNKNAKQLPVPAKQDVDIQVVFADYVKELNKLDSEYRIAMTGDIQFLKQKCTIIKIGEECALLRVDCSE